MTNSFKEIIDEEEIFTLLDAPQPSIKETKDVLVKAREGNGLSLHEVRTLITSGPEAAEEILAAAGEVKEKIYGNRLVLFAPLYLSNHCVNDCRYCGFRNSNNSKRTILSTEEIASEVKALTRMGHKRLLLECGEDPDRNTIDYVAGAISTIYSTVSPAGKIRRVNVNIAPPDIEGFKILKSAGIGTYQLFQETYHRPTYESMHCGPKADYERQIRAHDLAFEAGIDDVGLGVLFGLYDFRFELLSLISHARYLEKRFGVGPHTVSVPRLRAAEGVELRTGFEIINEELLLVIAVLRLALPYTGIILSTREAAELRTRAFSAGVTQASAGSAAAPGGYNSADKNTTQFTLADSRPVEEFLKSTLAENLLPSFCTACYRQGRTGEAFMELARPGEIGSLCRPNAILTF
ncbi:MAG: [FeFe] hydrogenase H-cluster radical SAM maturase HydG, partial [Thermodesulfobacteriota bacterium]